MKQMLKTEDRDNVGAAEDELESWWERDWGEDDRELGLGLSNTTRFIWFLPDVVLQSRCSYVWCTKLIDQNVISNSKVHLQIARFLQSRISLCTF